MEFYILGILVVAAIAYYCGLEYGKFLVISSMIKLLSKDELNELNELRHKLSQAKSDEDITRIIEGVEQSDLKMINLEVIDTAHFFYDTSGNFICQGSSIDSVVSNFLLVDRSATKVCVVNQAGERFYIVDGAVRSEIN